MKRVLVKLSGESLAGTAGTGIDVQVLNYFASEIESAYSAGTQIGIVLGGGNIFRGLGGSKKGVSRTQGDYMGMLATVINSLALQDALVQRGIPCTVLSGLTIHPLCDEMSGPKAIRLLNEGHVVIMAGGTGNPYFTTDTAGALRAIEIEADALLKGTRVDGVYSADPEKDPSATRFSELTFSEAYDKHLNIMDMTAFTLCRENHMPVVVFGFTQPGNLLAVIKGEAVGTTIKS